MEPYAVSVVNFWFQEIVTVVQNINGKPRDDDMNARIWELRRHGALAKVFLLMKDTNIDAHVGDLFFKTRWGRDPADRIPWQVALGDYG